MLGNAKFIIHPSNKLYEPVCFIKQIELKSKLRSAILEITSLGCYYATIDQKRVGDFILAPGFTSRKRVQCQTYNIKSMLKEKSTLEITVSEGWYKGKINFGADEGGPEKKKALIARLKLEYANGEREEIVTGEDWLVKKSKLRMAELYDGEAIDMTFEDTPVFAELLSGDHPKIVRQQGVYIKEQEAIDPVSIFKAPNGETIVDFGQNLTGYFEIELNARAGDRVKFSVCEILDRDGNFYNENYRDAKAEFEYICKDGYNRYKPILAFWGFRYIRVESFPHQIKKENIRAIVVHSDIKRTGYLESSNKMLNQLFSNIIWGQRGNFLDVPTDCPQRDERQGWTGDAAVFCKTATYNYDVEKFFEKWLTDMRLDQGKKGNIPNIIPQTICWDWSTSKESGALWGDSVTIIPYQIYRTYGSVDILRKMLPSMKKFLCYVSKSTKRKYLWYGCGQFGDWLGLDAPQGSYRGSSNEDFIASVFYANSVKIVCEVGKILGTDVEEYKTLYEKIIEEIRKTFKEYKTQTEHVLALYFDIAEDKRKTAESLAELIIENGKRLKTGFVGTPFLLHALFKRSCHSC